MKKVPTDPQPEREQRPPPDGIAHDHAEDVAGHLLQLAAGQLGGGGPVGGEVVLAALEPGSGGRLQLLGECLPGVGGEG
jgi:hypothetical protein